MTVASWELIARFVEQGLGIGYLPDYIGKTTTDSLQKLELDLPKVTYTVYVIYHKGQSSRYALEKFLTLKV
jgi:DNA-binding transcriptional LysR family regulator